MQATALEAIPAGLRILDPMRMGPHMLMPGDADAVRGARLRGRSLRRVWTFARPYRRTIAVFLGSIIVAALVELVPPLAFRRIIDDAIPDGDRAGISVLAAAVVAAALADAALAVVQR